MPFSRQRQRQDTHADKVRAVNALEGNRENRRDAEK